MSEPVRILILDDAEHDDATGFTQALFEALQRADVLIERAGFDTDADALLDMVARTNLTLVFKPC